MASSNPNPSAALQGCGWRQRCLGPAGPRVSRPGSTHQDFREEVSRVLAFPLQPQRAQSLLQPRRRARPRPPLQASWGDAPARRDPVRDWGAPRLWLEGASWTLQGRGAGSEPGDRPEPGGGNLAPLSSPASFKPSARLFPLKRRTWSRLVL